jgi:sec-independent protein translocase protein TatA
MFENLTLPHLLMVLVVVMLLFGAKRIPEIAGSMGKGIREFKKHIHDDANETSQNPSRVEPNPLTQGPGPGIRPDNEVRTEPKRLL